MLDDLGQSLRRHFHTKVTGAAGRDMTGMDFPVRVENHVSRPTTANAAAIPLHVLPIQNDAKMGPSMLVLRVACAWGKAALGEAKSCHIADTNPAAVEFPHR
jgi:hypothetical protein